jgi:hypothetical protein
MDAEALPALVGEVRSALGVGRPVSPERLAALAGATDILTLGAMAADVRSARHGDRATFVRVAPFAVEAGEPPPPGAGEVRLVGRPQTLGDAVAAVRRARSDAGPVPVRGFWLADLAALGADAFRAVHDAGLDEVAFATPSDAAAVAAARAAGLGVRVLAVEGDPDDRLGWLLSAHALAARVGGITAVAPLPRQLNRAEPTTGFADVRTVALARLLVDVPSVQVDWSLYGPKLAQVALTVGADDLDGVSPADDAALGPRRAAVEEVRRNIAAAGLTAAERDGRWAALAP